MYDCYFMAFRHDFAVFWQEFPLVCWLYMRSGNGSISYRRSTSTNARPLLSLY